MYGSPVNRVKITAYSAADSLPRVRGLTVSQKLREYVQQATFYVIMFTIDVAFLTSRVKNWFIHWRSAGSIRRGFEDDLTQQMANVMKSEYGVEIDPSMFDA